LSNRFFPATVSKIEKTTEDCVFVSLNFEKSTREQFAFTHGQYLTLKTEIKGESVQRSYSLASCPLDGEWKVGIKKVPQGKFSTYANEVLKVGDIIESMPPDGKFFVETDSKQSRHYAAFAAGSGITPMLSIIETHLRVEPESTFKLFYINQTAASVIGKEELEALRNQFIGRFEIFYFLTREHRSVPFLNGRLNEEKLKIIFKTICEVDDIDHYFSCGPEAMIFMVRDFLTAKGVDEKNIHFELFGTGDNKAAEAAKAKIADELKGEQSEISIIEGGKSFNYSLETGSNNILDGALNNGADLPYACKGGVCCTCKAMLVEGDVNMLVHYGLEPDEIDAGYILTCQAIPTSKKVVVDFDQ